MVVGSGWEVIMEKKKIFIIVENHELLEGIAQQFEKFSNYQIVGTANSAGDAITFFKTNNCDLLVIDLMLTDIDGVGVLEKVREVNKNAYQKVVCITSFILIILWMLLNAFFQMRQKSMRLMLMKLKKFKKLKSKMKSQKFYMKWVFLLI